MPLTRSQKEKDVPLRASSSASQCIEETSERRSEGSTSVTNSEATASISSIAESTGTTATNATVTMKMRSIEASARLKELKMTDRRKLNSSSMTMIPSGSICASVKSVRSTSSAARLRVLESREELARLELQRAEAAANLARIKFERQTLEDEVDDQDEEHEDRTSQVQNWIQTSPLEEMKDIPEQDLIRNKTIMKTEQPMMSSFQVTTLAGAIRQAFDNHTTAVMQPSSHLSQQANHDLPFYDGTSTEWVAFRVVYDDTSKSFNPTQNMSRLRKAIKGAARNTFKSLLYSDATPDQIMKALQRRYGRPDSLVMEELDRIKALPKITATPKDICGFASDIHNCISAIQGLQKPQYLCSPVMVREIVEKLPTYLKFRWYEYADAHEEQEPADLVLMAQFLNKQADTCGAYAPSEKKKLQHGREATHTATEGEAIEPQPVKKQHKKEKKNLERVRTIDELNLAPQFLDKEKIEECSHLKEHFAIKSLGVQSRRPTTNSEGRALPILGKTCQRQEDGCFEVGLLGKNEDDHMPESYKSAEKRLFSIEKKILHLKRKWYPPHFSVKHPLKKKVRRLNPDEEALTTNHFLIGRSNSAAKVGTFSDKDLEGRETWKTAQQLTEHFWKRWLREYLPTLLLRRTDGSPELRNLKIGLPTLLPRKTDGSLELRNLKIGDIVLIIDSSLPRCTWPRGKIQTVHPGPDGRTRIVDVETRGGVLRRPSSRIIVLVPSP